MILELSNGQELKLPDYWSDDRARAFGQRYMRGEVSQSEMDAATREAAAGTDTLQLILDELRAIKKVLLADRQIIQDPTTGEPTRSRVVVRRGT